MAELPQDAIDDPLVTTAGLFIEANAGFRGRLEAALAETFGLSGQWFEILMRLLRTPGHRLRMSDLAAQSTLSPSGLTRAVDRLEAAGLVRREMCPSDRRGAFAVLTETGEERISAAVPLHLQHLREVFGAVFTPEEVETFTTLLRRLRDEVSPEVACASDLGVLCAEEELP